MHTKTHFKNKSAAQAMVEFALVLPILLLVVYGLLETGRLLFIFASVNTASRQAVRYGSAIGMVDTNGDNTLDTPRYEDCAGITTTANNVAFLAPFNNINISYDKGLKDDGTPDEFTGFEWDPSLGDQCATLTPNLVGNRDRISVYVSAQFAPVVPFIPLDPITIESTASRTIIGEISIQVTDVGGEWDPSTGGTNSLTLEVLPKVGSETYTTLNQKITFVYTLTNSGTNDLSTPYQILTTSPAGTVTIDCSGAASTLVQGASTQCFGDYYITQADLNFGKVVNTATAKAGVTTSNDDSAESLAIQIKKIRLDIINAYPANVASQGDLVPFQFRVTNDLASGSNVTLTETFTIKDDNGKVATFVCSNTDINPGEFTDCSASYTITSADITNGGVEFNFYAQYTDTDGTILSNVVYAMVNTRPFVIENITGVLQSPVDPYKGNVPGDIITYTYRLRNNSPAATISGPFSIASGSLVVTEFACPANSIAPGAAIDCTSKYALTQAIINTGSVNYTGISMNGQISGVGTTSNQKDGASVIIAQVIDIDFKASVSPTLVTSPRDVQYSYSITNIGNVDLSNIIITDTNSNGNVVTLNCVVALAPGASQDPACQRTYSVTDNDIANGAIATSSLQVQVTYGSVFAKKTFIFDRVIQPPGGMPIVFTSTSPKISFSIAASPYKIPSTQSVQFTFEIRNIGNVDLADYTLTLTGGSDIPAVATTCNNPITPLLTGEATTCIVNQVVAPGFTSQWQVSAPPASPVTAAITVPEETLNCFFLTSAPINNQAWTIYNNAGKILYITSLHLNWKDRELLSVTLNPGTPTETVMFSGFQPVVFPSGFTINSSTATEWELIEGTNVISMSFSKIQKSGDLSMDITTECGKEVAP